MFNTMSQESVQSGNGDGDVVLRDDCDALQHFAYDIVEEKAKEREVKMKSVEKLRHYRPLRMFVSGAAGTGKSRTLRCYVRRRRMIAQGYGCPRHEAKDVTLLASPTGCASFHMKYGATTVHRAFSLGFGGCKAWEEKDRSGDRYKKVFKRLKKSTFMALDEISMIGKRMLGKIHYRMCDTLGDESREYNFDPLCVPSLNGKDCVINGHMLQARPIGDTEPYRDA